MNREIFTELVEGFDSLSVNRRGTLAPRAYPMKPCFWAPAICEESYTFAARPNSIFVQNMGERPFWPELHAESTDLTLSRASPAPTMAELAPNPVGVSLLAMAVVQPAMMLTDLTPSRAGSLLHGPAVIAGFVTDT